MQHYNIKVYGKVQGVFFRNSARKKAEEFGLSGYVRNDKDGSVYIEAEGEEYALDAFVDWVKEGPPAAEVEKVDIEKGVLRNFTDFSVTG